MAKRMVETTYTRTGPIPIEEFEDFVTRAIAGARSAGFSNEALVRFGPQKDLLGYNSDEVYISFSEEK